MSQETLSETSREIAKKLITKCTQKVYSTILEPRIFSQEISETDAQDKRDAFEMMLKLNLAKFQKISRDSGELYVHHLIRVLDGVLSRPDANFLEVFIAPGHDLIEDTDLDYHSLADMFGVGPAFGIHLMSKKPFFNFIYYGKDKKIMEDIQESGILNSKYLLSDAFKYDYFMFEEAMYNRYGYNIDPLVHAIRNFSTLDNVIQNTCRKHNINLEKLQFLENFKTIKNKYNSIKNERFFDNMESINNFIDHAYQERITLKINYQHLDDRHLESAAYAALKDKFLDRIDNLSTEMIYTNYSKNTLNKAMRKIEETKKYFYNIAQEYDTLFNTNFYKEIKKEVWKLEFYIQELQTKQWSSNSIEKAVD